MRVADDDRIGAPASADDQHQPGKYRRTKPRLAWLGIGLAVALGIVAIVRAGDRPSTLTPDQISSTITSEVGKGIGQAIRNFKKATSEPDEIDVTPKKGVNKEEPKGGEEKAKGE